MPSHAGKVTVGLTGEAVVPVGGLNIRWSAQPAIIYATANVALSYYYYPRKVIVTVAVFIFELELQYCYG